MSDVRQGRSLIESLGVYLPTRQVTTREVLDGCTRPVAFPMEKFTGIHSRPVAADNEFSIDLARRATADCLARSGRDPSEIGLIICCNISRCDGPLTIACEPSTAVKLRHDFGLSNALAFDLANGCAGMFTALAVVDAFLATGRIDSALVVSGEYITHLTRTAQLEIEGFMDSRMACLTLGDTGAALLVGRAPDAGSGFHALELYTLGRYGEYCVAQATEREHGGAIMYTDSVRMHAVTINEAISHAQEVLTRAGARPDAFEHLIMHQTSQKTLNDAAAEINRAYRRRVCHPGNVVDNLAARGNTATTSHFVALYDNIANGRVRAGDNILFSVTGSGLSIGTAIYSMDDLPDRINHRRVAVPADPQLAAPTASPRVRIESVATMPGAGAGLRRTVEMARLAADAALRTSRHERNMVDLLLYAGVYREAFLSEPAVAALVAGALDINGGIDAERSTRTLAFDVADGGLGFFDACHVAATMIRAGRASVAMVTTAEVDATLQSAQPSQLGIQETASAIILEGSTGEGFGSFEFRTFPEHEAAEVIDAHHERGAPRLLVHRADDLDHRYITCLAAVADHVLQLEQIDRCDLTVVLAPQRSSDFLTLLAAALGVPPGIVVDAGHGHGDLSTSSLPYALVQARESGLVEPASIGLVLAAGAGIQVGAAVYHF